MFVEGLAEKWAEAKQTLTETYRFLRGPQTLVSGLLVAATACNHIVEIGTDNLYGCITDIHPSGDRYLMSIDLDHSGRIVLASNRDRMIETHQIYLRGDHIGLNNNPDNKGVFSRYMMGTDAAIAVSVDQSGGCL